MTQMPKDSCEIVPALCVDLDGTIRYSKSGAFIQGPDDVALFPGVEAKLWEFRDKGYLILGISNQGGVAFGYKTKQDVDDELAATMRLFTRNPFHMVKICLNHPEGNVAPFNVRSLLRKPDYGMLALMECDLFEQGYVVNWDESLFVGDRPEDMECARNAGIMFITANTFFSRGPAIDSATRIVIDGVEIEAEKEG